MGTPRKGSEHKVFAMWSLGVGPWGYRSQHSPTPSKDSAASLLLFRVFTLEFCLYLSTRHAFIFSFFLLFTPPPPAALSPPPKRYVLAKERVLEPHKAPLLYNQKGSPHTSDKACAPLGYQNPSRIPENTGGKEKKGKRSLWTRQGEGSWLRLCKNHGLIQHACKLDPFCIFTRTHLGFPWMSHFFFFLRALPCQWIYMPEFPS